eukprot:TRINITY_DN15738_c0_g1_i1.p1 TRINITY_DN15738_c0_g1~~TRINITY_DN15738_c0_g1_i1.p1  ORF type:complete len:335 (+),score=120.07 TRINITY_DN15738_c0_g1_i1:146-1150(+)
MEDLKSCFSKIQEEYEAVSERKRQAEAGLAALEVDRQEKMNSLVRELEETRIEATAQLFEEVTRLKTERDLLAERHVQCEDVVALNVGGVRFTTKLSTLLSHPDSMLSALFSGRHTLPKDSSGAVFVDRDGQLFRFVLNYLRTGRAPARHDMTPFEFEQLCCEADYFNLPGLLELLRSKDQRNISYAVLSHKSSGAQWLVGASLAPSLRHPPAASLLSTSPAGGGGIFVNPPFVASAPVGIPAVAAAVPVPINNAGAAAAPVTASGRRTAGRYSHRRVFPEPTVMGQEKSLEEVLEETLECGWTLMQVSPDLPNNATLYVFQKDNDRAERVELE